MPKVFQLWGASLLLTKYDVIVWFQNPDSSNRVVARDTTMEPTSPSEQDRGRMTPLGRNVGVPRRGMRPAGVSGPARLMAPVGVIDVKRKSAIRLLSVEAVEFSPHWDRR